ncbi:MAG TPA: methyltransferase domain-containing protein [Conexibacter sp.]|nr:methyltransferase domain-containing protein [Conexibacter sp.]
MAGLLGRRRGKADGNGAGRLRIAAPPGARLVLHVGCGRREEQRLDERFAGPGWHEVRLDIDPDVEPDVVASITDMSPVPDATVDAVYSHHNIEHVFAHEVALAMSEFFRVLKPGGEVLVATPDLQTVARTIASGRLEDTLYRAPDGNITPLDVVYGLRSDILTGREYMAHRTGFTRGTLARKLGAAGFVDVAVERRVPYALWGSGRRPVA